MVQDGILLVGRVEIGQPDEPLWGRGEEQPAGRRVVGGVGNVEQPGRGRAALELGQRRLGIRAEGPELTLKGRGVVNRHGWYSLRSRLSPSWTLRRAASSLVRITAEMSVYDASTTKRRTSAVRCLSGRSRT